MRIRLALTLDIERKSREPEAPEVYEYSGSTTEVHQQPRYAGFAVPEES